MPSSIGALLAVAALGGLSVANMPPAAAPVALAVEICGGHGVVTIPLDGSPPARHRDCPAGCHAVCGRRNLVEADED
ncbi:hypothetical protein ABC974_19465 [Sphingomonas oligophenolica]|uniref:DUF2946 domain-containing protein n=1 Tax=Sphingomonas oligophenolica TaxID=301154 RepID=A0ABU9Y7P0_9SPHN